MLIEDLCPESELAFTARIVSLCAHQLQHKSNLTFRLYDVEYDGGVPQINNTLAVYATGNIPDMDPT
jgi:hypothetical protein